MVAVEVTTIWRSQTCKRSQRSVSISPSRSSKCTLRPSWRDAMSGLLQNRTTTSQPFLNPMYGPAVRRKKFRRGEGGELAGEGVRTDARLHANQARRQIGQPCLDLTARPRPALIAPPLSWPTMWKEFLPMSMPITAICRLAALGMLFAFSPPLRRSVAPESYAGPPMLFLARSPAISISEKPASASTSSVCVPSSGDG